jgi:hypothetical protein
MRSTWTDERLDDLATRMGHGFERVHDDLRAVRSDVRSLSTEMNSRFDSLNRDINGRFDSLNRTIIRFAGAWVISSAAVIVSFMLTHG